MIPQPIVDKFPELTDVKAILLAPYYNTEKWLTQDEIVSWCAGYKRFLNPETVKKYTIPQDPKLKGMLVAKWVRDGGRRKKAYQLSRRGMTEAKKIVDELSEK